MLLNTINVNINTIGDKRKNIAQMDTHTQNPANILSYYE